jgi:Kdo2-lipid IVA lauroyltransferase/acyltransferase
MIGHYLSFLAIRLLTLPSLLMPYSWNHAIGKRLGTLSYYLLTKFRKRTMSNLALALPEIANREREKIAKEAMQNLMITCLDYPKLSWEREIHRVAFCENPDHAREILEQGRGVIFFCGHQSNWEVLFLEGTKRMPGVAIGRPIKNRVLYRWVLSMREKYGGEIIHPQNAFRAGFKALKRGSFLGIVGDQGMPDSGYHSPFFGKRAWSSPLPALLSYRSGSPIIVATTHREKNRYRIHYSEPLWPNSAEPMEKEIDRLMRAALSLLEESIRKHPGEWLWQHNRWKQQTPLRVKRPFRHESILIILPQDPSLFAVLEPHLATFRAIYPLEFITLYIPHTFQEKAPLSATETIVYHSTEELFVNDFRFKLIFNFSSEKRLIKHFLKLSAFKVLSLEDLHQLAGPSENLSELLTKSLLHAP